jgi:hypothetical protein
VDQGGDAVSRLSLRQNDGRGGLKERAPDPTRLAIIVACKKFQRSWTAEERHLRKRYYQG